MTTNDFDELTPEQTANVFENDDTIRRTLKHINEYGNPVITGDSDTDELLEDERIAQEEVAKELKEKADRKAEEYIEDLAIEELDDIDYKRFTGITSDISDTEACPYDEPLHNHHDGCPSCTTQQEYAEEYFKNERAKELEDIIVDQQINFIRCK